jgi:hypothetical protein
MRKILKSEKIEATSVCAKKSLVPSLNLSEKRGARVDTLDEISFFNISAQTKPH